LFDLAKDFDAESSEIRHGPQSFSLTVHRGTIIANRGRGGCYEKDFRIIDSNHDFDGSGGADLCPRQELPQPELRFTKLQFNTLRSLLR
jgi:hypothetical protein